MGEIKLLDCTLRDGGYVNDWEFGHDNIVSIFERLVDAGLDIIEIGFLDDRRPFDINRSIMPDTDSVQKIYGELDRKQALVVGMIDFGTCSLEHIKPADQCFLDGIRVIFKKHLREPAMEFCGQLKALGYKVFAQLVSATSYNDEEMMDLIRLANKVKPYAVSIVDTYGLMHQDNLLHYFKLLNKNLDKSIGLGYHAHNNFQMGYANGIAMLSQKAKRTMIVDGSIYGMGKSAGNAPVELLAMHLNQKFDKHYNVSQILEAVDSNIMQFYKPATWGYNLFFYIAASNDCHPNYVSYLMNKRTLSISQINLILSKLEGEKQLLYDKKLIESLYVKYQKKEIDDSATQKILKKELADKEILLIGPGSTIKKDSKMLSEYIEESKPLVISINCIPDFCAPDYVFLSNSKRYLGLATKLCRKKYNVIATSNITPTCENDFSYVLNFSSLMDPECEFIDNSLIMFLKELIKIKVKKVSLAGFDGYSVRAANYYISDMEYDFVKKKADYLNAYTSDFLKKVAEDIEVSFITPTRYNEAKE